MTTATRTAALTLLAVLSVSAADPRIGAWKLVAAHSSVDPPPRLIITGQPHGVHVVVLSSPRMEFSANWDGRDYSVQKALGFNQIAIHRKGRTQAEVTEKKDGVVVATMLESVSHDGNQLTITTHPVGKRQEINILKRTAGAKTSANPFIGEWIQDLSTTRLRQGLPLDIRADGNNGVHFSGDFEYDAKLDGKDYTLRNSRNDTVALTPIDTRTLESAYKRGDQIVERDRWVLSPDGLRLTVTTTGVLPAGEHLSEELVFQKQ